MSRAEEVYQCRVQRRPRLPRLPAVGVARGARPQVAAAAAGHRGPCRMEGRLVEGAFHDSCPRARPGGAHRPLGSAAKFDI